MSIRIVTVCDVCDEFEWGDGPEGWEVHARQGGAGCHPRGGLFHICRDCQERGVWWCEFCGKAHGSDVKRGECLPF